MLSLIPRRHPLLAALLLAALPVVAHADAVTEWNQIAAPRIATAGSPPIQTRLYAIMHIAMHDALNAITPRYDTYTTQSPARAGASPEAAVLAAGYSTLKQLLPTQAERLQLFYDHRIAELPACPAASPDCIADGVSAGEAAATAILALRQDDGSATPNLPYTLPAGPGIYQLTPPNFPTPFGAGLGQVKPFALNSGSQFRAEPDELMDLSSLKYALEFEQVKRYGDAAMRSAEPDSEPSRIARYWASGGADWNAVTRVIVAGRGLDLWQHARLFALLNMANADAAITVFETKYHYNFWRPITAIRAADTDGNPLTTANPQWLSYLTNPPYPDYTSGLSNLTGSATEVLRQYFGNAVDYTFTAGGITRRFQYLPDADAEAAISRMYAGIHFHAACKLGIKQGAHVGKFVVQHHLRPR